METSNDDATILITKNRMRKFRGSEKNNYTCTQCNKFGHTKKCCFEIIGYPEWWDHSRASKKISKTPTVEAVTVADE
jgi:hypothetical protein